MRTVSDRACDGADDSKAEGDMSVQGMAWGYTFN